MIADDDRLSAYLDGELTATERAGLEAELATGAPERRALDELREVRSLVRGLGPVPVPDGLLAEVTAAVRAAGDDPVVTPIRRRRGRVVALAGVAAAAAAVVLALVVPDPSRSTPSIATAVRTHQAGTASAGDPVSGLAPLATPMGFGR